MSHINNSSQDLFAIDAVQDLSHESAAAIGGGATTPDVILYDRPYFQGNSRPIYNAVGDLGNYDNKTSSIKVLSKKAWRFWASDYFKGRAITLNRGNYSQLPREFNNNIESLKSV
jgi:hypothetical protein